VLNTPGSSLDELLGRQWPLFQVLRSRVGRRASEGRAGRQKACSKKPFDNPTIKFTFHLRAH
jgi:hypothetical protein